MWKIILVVLTFLGGYSFCKLMPPSIPMSRLVFSVLFVFGVVSAIALALLPLRDESRFISPEFYRGIVIAVASTGLMGLVFLFLNKIWH